MSEPQPRAPGGPPPGTFATTAVDAYPGALDLNLLSVVAGASLIGRLGAGYLAGGSGTSTETVTITAPAPEATSNFEVVLQSETPAVGYRYEQVSGHA